MKSTLFSFAALMLATSCIQSTIAQQPDQLHISLSGKPNEMVVEFVSHAAVGANYVWWSSVPFSPFTCYASSSSSSSTNHYIQGAGYLTEGDDLYNAPMSVVDAEVWCNNNSSCMGFTFSDADPTCNNTAKCDMYFKSALSFVAAPGWTSYFLAGPPCLNTTTTFHDYQNATLGAVGVLHQAILTNLQPNTTYYYIVGNATGGYSPMRHFTNSPQTRPPIFAILADFGLSNDESLLQLYTDAAENNFDYVIHAGDFAYNLDDNNGEVGNEFMRAIEQYTALYPLIICPGNHESHNNYSHYQNRFAGVAQYAGENSGSGSSVYFSLDIGLVHFVMFSTEVYWSMQGAVDAQLNWLKNDLRKANTNRAAVPWIIAISHKAWYMDTTYCPDDQPTNCYANGTWFDSLLYENGVDLAFVGHMHEYRRFVPNYGSFNLTDPGSMSPNFETYTDPKYMTTIVTGAPGNQEVQPSDCGSPTPSDTVFPTATCSRNYGYGYLTIQNTTHVTWNWKTTVPISGSPDPFYSDSFTLIVNNHGPRK